MTTSNTKQALIDLSNESNVRSIYFGDQLNRIARDAATDCSPEILAILNESLDNESPAYSQAQLEDDNGQMIDVLADALGYQSERKNADDFEGMVGEATQSNLMIVLDNLEMFVGREASWLGGFDSDKFERKQTKVINERATHDIAEIIFDKAGRVKSLNGDKKPRRQRVARAAKRNAK